jgi:stalled ribosome rescue protein Dom34
LSAIGEVIKRPELAKALKDDAAASEEILIEELLKALHDEKASIGLDECYEAINSGKSAKFLVSENLIMELRQADKFTKLEELMKAAEGSGSEVHLIGSKDAAKQLDGIGGIGCINRW